MITYEQLEKANKSINAIEIKGSPYASVAQRIKAFRMCYPSGTIETNIVSNENGVCIIRARVGYSEDGKYTTLGEGTAYEKENSSFINKTSYIENCETSAVGRALGMAGFGIDNEVASYEEAATANLNQETISAEQKKALTKMLTEANIPEKYVCDLYGVEQIKELNVPKYTNLVNNWDKFKKKYDERKNS